MKKKTLTKVAYVLTDMFVIFLSYFLTVLVFSVLNLDFDYKGLSVALPTIILFKIMVFALLGIYKAFGRYIGYREILVIGLANIFINIFIVSVLQLGFVPKFMPKSSYLFITTYEVAGLVLYRIALKLFRYVNRLSTLAHQNGRTTIIVGAGSAAELAINEIVRNKKLNNKIVGLLDDDEDKIGRTIYDYPIIGKLQDIDFYINEYNVQEVIIAINNFNPIRESELIHNINKYEHIRVKKIKLLSEYEEIQRLSIVDIKVEDLLEREPVDLDTSDIKNFIEDEIVLVTGGGGSIGSELSRQIYSYRPKKLIIFDIYENNAYDIEMELLRRKRRNPLHQTEVITLIGSVYNRERIEEVFRRYSPTLVFHAAAYKHVPLMENSPREAIRTNVVGTKNVSELANKYNVKKMVFVSTDKAVRPTNVMGATKRYAEMILAHENSKGPTKISAVRFGNVLGSNGSVIPLFKKQIEEGGPLTVTHKDITRYFMTIPEAVGLILQSAVYANGGEIFVLDMGKPVKIYELAQKMIALSGYTLGKDIDIEVTGLRPGEKLYEELLIDSSNNDLRNTNHSRVFIERDTGITYDSLDYDYVLNNFDTLSKDDIKVMLTKVVDTYTITDN